MGLFACTIALSSSHRMVVDTSVCMCFMLLTKVELCGSRYKLMCFTWKHLRAVTCVAVCGAEVVLNVDSSLEMSQEDGLHHSLDPMG